MNDKARVLRCQRAQPIGQEVVAKPVRRPYAHRSGEGLGGASNARSHFEEFALCALGSRDKRLARRRQRAA